MEDSIVSAVNGVMNIDGGGYREGDGGVPVGMDAAGCEVVAMGLKIGRSCRWPNGRHQAAMRT